MPAELGSKIRAARLACGLSLRATATRAGISASLLSQVETGKVQPSVGTLYAVVTCLGISVDDLLDLPQGAREVPRSGRGDPVQRSEAAPEIAMQNGVTWRALAVMGAGDGVDALLATYAPGAGSSLDDTHMRHAGIEYGYIIRGELTLRLDFDSYVLRAGDSVCFDSMRPHLYRNDTDEVVEGIWFVTGGARASAAPPTDVRNAADVLEIMSSLPSRGQGSGVGRG